MQDYNNMTNAEIKIKMTEYENHYTVLQTKISALLEELNKVNEEYIKARDILSKRTK